MRPQPMICVKDVEASSRFKLDWYVNTAIFWFAVENQPSACLAVKKAHPLVNDIEKSGDLYLRFKSCYARVQDYERNWLAAAREYRFLSQQYGQVDEASMLESLKYAITCAILADASPDREKMLTVLYFDERSSQLPNFTMLEKMFKERIIRKSEVEKFEKLLAPHQNAILPDDITILGRAVMKHNMRAVSKIYRNISFAELGHILGISAQKAEDLASTMIEKKQMEGTIDQVEGFLEFNDQTGSLRSWDKQITEVCQNVNDVLDDIVKRHPQYSY